MSWVLPVGIDFADGVTVLPSQPSDTDGTPTVVGTPLPTADIYIFDSARNQSYIEEPPGSPEIERAEQCTCSHTLKMSWVNALYYWSMLPRGTIVTDSAANIWRILSCKAKRIEGTIGEFSYVMESISFDSPPDDFSLNDTQMDFDILKHPRYAWALIPYVTDASTYYTVSDYNFYYTQIKQSIVRGIQAYKDSPIYPTANQISGYIQDNVLNQISNGKLDVTVPNPNYIAPTSGQPSEAVRWSGLNADLSTSTTTSKIATSVQNVIVSIPVNLANSYDPISIALAAANELIQKLWRQEDTPYVAGYEVVWSQYFFQPVYLNPGGYIEDPRNWVPDYFMNPGASSLIPRGNQFAQGPIGGLGGGNGDTVAAGGSYGASIFDYLTSINPQLYAVNGQSGGELSFSCLRKSDHYDYERTWFKISHSWLCAPIGKWDSDLYNQNHRPQQSTDYNQLKNSFTS